MLKFIQKFNNFKYNSELRSKVIELRKKGYFGDGYWSSGYRLSDNERIKGESEIRDSDFMDYICGKWIYSKK